MSDTTTTNADPTAEQAEQAAPVMTIAEQVRTIGDASLAVDETAIEKLIEETAETMRKGLPHVRTVRGVYRRVAEHALAIAVAVRAHNGHPDWARKTKAYGAVWQACFAKMSEGLSNPPTTEEIETYQAGIRQAIHRGSRDAAIVAYVLATVNDAETIQAEKPEQFKRLVRAEYESANLQVPKEWAAEGSSGSGTGAGPARDDSADAYTTAVSGVSGLYDAETKAGVTPLLHTSVVLSGLCDLAERLAPMGEIQDRTKVADALLAAGEIFSLAIQRVEAPDTFGENELDKLADAIKSGRKLAESARK